jgi:hypothetical protein
MTEISMLGYCAIFWLAKVVFARPVVDNASEEPLNSDALTTVYDVKARYEAKLLSKPNVVAVGIGIREGYPDPVIIVSVSKKLPLNDLRAQSRVPKSLEGIVVCVEEIGEPIPLTDKT